MKAGVQSVQSHNVAIISKEDFNYRHHFVFYDQKLSFL